MGTAFLLAWGSTLRDWVFCASTSEHTVAIAGVFVQVAWGAPLSAAYCAVRACSAQCSHKTVLVSRSTRLS